MGNQPCTHNKTWLTPLYVTSRCLLRIWCDISQKDCIFLLPDATPIYCIFITYNSLCTLLYSILPEPFTLIKRYKLEINRLNHLSQVVVIVDECSCVNSPREFEHLQIGLHTWPPTKRPQHVVELMCAASGSTLSGNSPLISCIIHEGNNTPPSAHSAL